MYRLVVVSEPLLECGCQLGEGALWVSPFAARKRLPRSHSKDARRQRLYFVDIEDHKIYTYDPSSGTHGYQTFLRRPTALALLNVDSGVRPSISETSPFDALCLSLIPFQLLVSFDNGPGFVPFTALPFPPTNSPSSYTALDLDIPPVDGFNRFNEACVDPTGRRWMLGSMMHEGHLSYTNGGALHSIEVDDNNKLTARLELDDVTVVNGMGWSRDLKTM